MKLAIAWFSALALLIVISCSVNHRSGDYACTKQSDCTNPRTCMDGFCIVPDGVPIDGPPGPHVDAKGSMDANGCPAMCTSCDVGTRVCKIDCQAPGANCNLPVVCPPGFNCTVDCDTSNSCRNGITCTGTLSCSVVCSGQNSCQGVECGAGPCAVDCSGAGSCRGVTCGPACYCNVECSDLSCSNVACSLSTCDTPTGGCNKNNPGCNVCH